MSKQFLFAVVLLNKKYKVLENFLSFLLFHFCLKNVLLISLQKFSIFYVKFWSWYFYYYCGKYTQFLFWVWCLFFHYIRPVFSSQSEVKFLFVILLHKARNSEVFFLTGKEIQPLLSDHKKKFLQAVFDSTSDSISEVTPEVIGFTPEEILPRHLNDARS